MTITKRYNTAKEDYETLLRLYDASGADDITGSWLADEKLFDLLENPCKKEAADIYESLIQRVYDAGFEDGIEWDSDCEKTMEIFERHDCEYMQEATSGNNINW